MSWRLSDLPIEARLAAERAAASQGSTLETWLVEALRASLPREGNASRHRPSVPGAAELRLAETSFPPDASAVSQSVGASDFGTRVPAQLAGIRQQPPALVAPSLRRDDSWTPLVPRLVEAQKRLPQSEDGAPTTGEDAPRMPGEASAECEDLLRPRDAATAVAPLIARAPPTVPPMPEIAAPVPYPAATPHKQRPILPSGPPSLLPLAAIMPARHRLRRGGDEHQLMALAVEIGMQGVREPVLVRPASDRASYEIVAGERRRLAADRAGITEIPAIVVQADDGAALLLSLAENLGRSDFTPLDEARAYLRLLTEFRISPSALAERLGISRLQIASSLRLLGLPQRARQEIEGGRLNAEQAYRLLDAADPDATAERLTASARPL
jgi:ParB/RepB/Spo0J family partition protein